MLGSLNFAGAVGVPVGVSLNLKCLKPKGFCKGVVCKAFAAFYVGGTGLLDTNYEVPYMVFEKAKSDCLALILLFRITQSPLLSETPTHTVIA